MDVNDVVRRSVVFIVNFEHISHLFLVLLLLSLKKQMLAGQYRIVTKGAIKICIYQ